MAAGRSTRFGPDDKRLAELNGEPLLMQLVRRLLPVFPPFRDQPRLSVVLRPEDVTLALEADRYSFAMKISREDGLLVARKQEL